MRPGAPQTGVRRDYLTVSIEDQEFGIPALMVHDIMEPQKISPIPLTPPEILGVLNLRGHIVTAIDMRARLGLPPRTNDAAMCVVIEVNDVPYSLIVDAVGEVVALDDDEIGTAPSNMSRQWADISNGVYRENGSLMLIMDVARVLELDSGAESWINSAGGVPPPASK